jgi:hypothetical protein
MSLNHSVSTTEGKLHWMGLRDDCELYVNSYYPTICGGNWEKPCKVQFGCVVMHQNSNCVFTGCKYKTCWAECTAYMKISWVTLMNGFNMCQNWSTALNKENIISEVMYVLFKSEWMWLQYSFFMKSFWLYMFRMLFASIISSTTAVYSHKVFLSVEDISFSTVSSGVEVYFMLIVLVFQNLMWYLCVGVCPRVCFGVSWFWCVVQST